MRRFRGGDLVLGLLAVAANVALVTGVVMLTSRTSSDVPLPPPTTTSAPSSTPATSPAVPQPTTASPVVALPRLATASRPVTLAVLGDGTGDEEGEWVTSLGTLLGRDHRVVVHNLELTDPTRYAARLTYGDTGPAFTIWNGSRRGASADYAVTRLPFMVPTRPDAVLLSYGRDDAAGDIGRHLDVILGSLRTRWPDVPVSVVLQAPERDDAGADTRKAAAAWAKGHRLTTIDVAAAFRKAGDPNAFVSVVDPPSVNQRGGELWGLAVFRALGGTADDPVEEAPPAPPATTTSTPEPAYTPVRPRPRPRPQYTPPPADPTTEPAPTGTSTPTGTPEPSPTGTATGTPSTPPPDVPSSTIGLPPQPDGDAGGR